MSNANFVSKPGLATTLLNEPRPAPNTESEFLSRQREDARLAMEQAVRDLGISLNKFAADHPLIALGSAAAVGALAARMTASPVREPSIPERVDGEEKPSLMDAIQKSVFDLARAGIESYLAAALAPYLAAGRTSSDSESKHT